jgi:two-component system, OmpR family, KDP operon response regulator KdpE
MVIEPSGTAVVSEAPTVASLHDPVAVLIEDDPQIRRLLRTVLPNHGFRLIDVGTGLEGLRELELHRADILLLDLGLPDLDGMQVIQRLREWSAVPILVLSARKQERDKIAALDAGADDYVSKPFSVGELLSRMRVLLRRSAQTRDGTQPDAALTVGTLQVDLVHRRVTAEGKEVHLTPIEYRLLTALVRDAGKVITQRQLLTEVWGPTLAEEVQYLRVYMAQLRRKLETDPARPKLLITEPGVGYRLAIG